MKERERRRGNRERSREAMKQRMKPVTRRKKQRKAKNSASILQRLRFNPTKIPIITTFESPIYRESASFPHQAQSIAASRKKKTMGINTVTLYICHHQIVETDSDTFFSIFLDLGMKYYFLLSFFCWIGLDLILVSIPFCFPSLSLSLFSNICVHSFFFFYLENTF